MPERFFMILLFIGAVAITALSIYLYGPDNPVEELAEDVIKIETGIDVDLTPESPENHVGH